MAKRPSRHIQKIKDLRARLWPDLDDAELWHRKDATGFTTIPRTLPIVNSIIDDLTKGAPASSTYLELWCRAYDEMYVSLSRSDEMAFHAGFRGQRSRRTWMGRIERLAELGFIRVAAGSAGKLSHAVIINPHIALKRLRDRNEPGLTEAAYNAFIERANEIGATDIDHDPVAKAAELEDEVPF